MCMNNLYIRLVVEPKYILKIHSVHAKNRVPRCFKGIQIKKTPFLGHSLAYL